jgi:hypothetical protein
MIALVFRVFPGQRFEKFRVAYTALTIRLRDKSKPMSRLSMPARVEHRRVSSPSPSLGSSMDGALYRSYDNYLGDQGFRQPRERSRSPQPGC